MKPIECLGGLFILPDFLVDYDIAVLLGNAAYLIFILDSIGLALQDKDVTAVTIWKGIRQQRFKRSSFDHDQPHFMLFIVPCLYSPASSLLRRVIC